MRAPKSGSTPLTFLMDEGVMDDTVIVSISAMRLYATEVSQMNV